MVGEEEFTYRPFVAFLMVLPSMLMLALFKYTSSFKASWKVHHITLGWLVFSHTRLAVPFSTTQRRNEEEEL